MSLSNDIRQIVKSCAAPRTLDQIMEQLPIGTDRNTVGTICNQRKCAGEFTRCVEDGKTAFVYAEGYTASPKYAVKRNAPKPKDAPEPPAAPAKTIAVVPQPTAKVVTASALPRNESATPPVRTDVLAQRLLIEIIGDSATSAADALDAAIESSSSRELLSQLASAARALHAAHVEVLRDAH